MTNPNGTRPIPADSPEWRGHVASHNGYVYSLWSASFFIAVVLRGLMLLGALYGLLLRAWRLLRRAWLALRAAVLPEYRYHK